MENFNSSWKIPGKSWNLDSSKEYERKHGKILSFLKYTFIAYFLQTKVDC